MIIYGDLDLTIRGKPKPKQWFHNEHIETWNDMDMFARFCFPHFKTCQFTRGGGANINIVYVYLYVCIYIYYIIYIHHYSPGFLTHNLWPQAPSFAHNWILFSTMALALHGSFV